MDTVVAAALNAVALIVVAVIQRSTRRAVNGIRESVGDANGDTLRELVVRLEAFERGELGFHAQLADHLGFPPKETDT